MSPPEACLAVAVKIQEPNIAYRHAVFVTVIVAAIRRRGNLILDRHIKERTRFAVVGRTCCNRGDCGRLPAPARAVTECVGIHCV